MMRRIIVLLLAAVFLTVLSASIALAGNGHGNGNGNRNGNCSGDCVGDYSWVRRGRGNG